LVLLGFCLVFLAFCFLLGFAWFQWKCILEELLVFVLGLDQFWRNH
jgi:hypothetical protein